MRVTSAPAIEHRGQLASLFTSLSAGDILFVDEIHALDRAIAETLYSALEDRVLDMSVGRRVIRVPLPRFTLVGATTHLGWLPAPLRDRFGITCHLRPYDVGALATIVARSAGLLDFTIDASGCAEIARRSRGTPRIANKLLRRVRDAAANIAPLMIDGTVAAAALDEIGVDFAGLVELDRLYLGAVADRPIGLDAIAAQLGEDRRTLEDAIEPHLIQAGFVRREAHGRVATDAGLVVAAENYFGSYRAAAKLVGFDSSRKPWSRKRVIDELRRRANGGTRVTNAQAGPALTLAAWKLFGRFSNACLAAGLECHTTKRYR